MNCCDANGKCTCRQGEVVPVQRSCDELATCQARKPRCPGCTAGLAAVETLRFAPGAVEAYKPGFFGSPAQRRELQRWAINSLAIFAVAVSTGLIAGLIVGAIKGMLR